MEPGLRAYTTVTIHVLDRLAQTTGSPPISIATLETGNPGPVREVQILRFAGSITGGTFRLAYNGVNTPPIEWSSDNDTLVASINAGLEAHAALGAGDVVASAAEMTAGVGTIDLTFTASLGNPTKLGMANNLTGAGATLSVIDGIVGSTRRNEVQVLIVDWVSTTLPPTPPTGTFRLGFDGQETGSITYSGYASTLNANLYSGLSALPSIGPNHILISSNNFAGLVRIEFGGTLSGIDVPQLTILENGLASYRYAPPMAGVEVILKKSGVEESRGVTNSTGSVRLPIYHPGTGFTVELTGHPGTLSIFSITDTGTGNYAAMNAN